MRHALILDPKNLAHVVAAHRMEYTGSVPIVAISGGFDILHVGHIRCIRDSALLKGKKGLLIVIVNGDQFLMKKNGIVYTPLVERMELISSLKGVDYVTSWEDESQFVTGAIEIIKPNIFAKGGNRSIAENIPEYDKCLELGCTVVFGMGGSNKVQSSFDLISKVKDELK